jgi:predicted 3-demethylubiquinone-9 3-methyltransferase (glyoxalase superfamily)
MPVTITQKLTPFLAFQGNAEEAMEFYTSLFDDAEIVQVIRAREEDPGWTEGTLQHAIFSLAGQQVMFINTPPPGNHLHKVAAWHEFAFNPSFTIYLRCDSNEEFDRLYEAFSEKGDIHLPAASYGFSPKFAWVTDRYGISWRLNSSTNRPGNAGDQR